jgi:hypothetical protein
VFSVGQRVRCVNGSFPYNALDWARSFPVTGAVYTIRRTGPQAHYLSRSMGPAVWLEEIVNPLLHTGEEPSFSAERFRALEDHQSSRSSQKAAIKRKVSLVAP